MKRSSWFSHLCRTGFPDSRVEFPGMCRAGAGLTCLSTRCGHWRCPVGAPPSCLNTGLRRGALTRAFSAMGRRGLAGSGGALARLGVCQFQFEPRLISLSRFGMWKCVVRILGDALISGESGAACVTGDRLADRLAVRLALSCSMSQAPG